MWARISERIATLEIGIRNRRIALWFVGALICSLSLPRRALAETPCFRCRRCWRWLLFWLSSRGRRYGRFCTRALCVSRGNKTLENWRLMHRFVRTWKTARQCARSLSITSKTHPASSAKSIGKILPCLCLMRTSTPLIPAKHISNKHTMRPPSLISWPAQMAPSLINSCVALNAFLRSSTFWMSGLSLPEK